MPARIDRSPTRRSPHLHNALTRTPTRLPTNESNQTQLSKVVVVDDLFSAVALAELQRFTRVSPAFRAMRGGFLGAFPADGAGHPVVLALARALEAGACWTHHLSAAYIALRLLS